MNESKEVAWLELERSFHDIFQADKLEFENYLPEVEIETGDEETQNNYNRWRLFTFYLLDADSESRLV